jgi:hypothetical protein
VNRHMYCVARRRASLRAARGRINRRDPIVGGGGEIVVCYGTLNCACALHLPPPTRMYRKNKPRENPAIAMPRVSTGQPTQAATAVTRDTHAYAHSYCNLHPSVSSMMACTEKRQVARCFCSCCAPDPPREISAAAAAARREGEGEDRAVWLHGREGTTRRRGWWRRCCWCCCCYLQQKKADLHSLQHQDDGGVRCLRALLTTPASTSAATGTLPLQPFYLRLRVCKQTESPRCHQNSAPHAHAHAPPSTT